LHCYIELFLKECKNCKDVALSGHDKKLFLELSTGMCVTILESEEDASMFSCETRILGSGLYFNFYT